MNRWLWMASLIALVSGTSGCLHHNTRGGCQTGQCGTGACNSCGKGGLLGKLGCNGNCGSSGCRTGCIPGPIGWQQGGMNYSAHLHPHCGTQGHGGIGHGMVAQHLMPGHYAAQQIQNQPFNAGPPTGTVAYPYYSHRGPRDFLLDNPPSIGR